MSSDTRVSLQRCASYDAEAVTASLEALLGPLGGMGAFVGEGERVLLKPNLLLPSAPDAAVTTHPAIVAGVISAVKSAGAVPVVGDSPGLITHGIENIWRETGMAQVCEDAGVELVSFETAGAERIETAGQVLHISKAVTDADVVISLPKLKTHSMTVLTSAVKNLYGTLPGMSKGDWHARLPKPSTFQGLLVDVLEAARPDLSIVDAVVGREGDGPSSGEPKELGFLAAGTDPVALDAVSASLVGLDPRKIRYLCMAQERGLGVMDEEGIEIVGAQRGELQPESFRPARTSKLQYLPEFLLNVIKRWVWVRPGFMPECKLCGECVQKCPANALAMGEHHPLLDSDRCIECFCCHEICHESAVELRLSLLARLFSR